MQVLWKFRRSWAIYEHSRFFGNSKDFDDKFAPRSNLLIVGDMALSTWFRDDPLAGAEESVSGWTEQRQGFSSGKVSGRTFGQSPRLRDSCPAESHSAGSCDTAIIVI